MGFFSKIAEIVLGESSNEVKEEINGYDIEFQESMIVNFAKIRQKILTMKIYYPEKAEEIEEKITNLENYIENNIEMNEEAQNYIKQAYQEIETNFELFNKISEEKFVFSEAKRIYKELDKLFCGEIDSGEEIDANKVTELENFLINLEEKKTQFTGVKQQQYISSIIKAKYRLKCCKMLMKTTWMSNIFEGSPEVEKVFYANIFTKDIEEMYKQIELMKRRYSLANVDISLETEESKLDELVVRIQEEYTEKNNGLITEIFDDEYAIKKYIIIRRNLRNRVVNLSKHIEKEKANIAKKEQEEKNAKARKEKLAEKKKKYKELPEEEQIKELQKICEETFSISATYKRILDYEIEVAEEKQLLNSKNELIAFDTQRLQILDEELYLAITRLNEQKIKYLLLIDKELKQNILVTEKDKDIKKLLDFKKDYDINHAKQLYEGKFGKSFIYYLSSDMKDIMYGFSEKGQLIYLPNFNNKEIISKQIYKSYQEIQEIETKPEDIEQVNFFIEMPLDRPICPILEILKQEGIEYYILPTNEGYKNVKNPFKRIFIDRKYLEKYKELVHEKISNEEKGQIKIGLEEFELKDTIMLGTDIPYINEKQEEKLRKQKEKEVLGDLTEQLQKEIIKELDNKNFDVTTSYKLIIESERKIAEAKGLLDEKSGMSSDDVEFFRINKDEIYEYLLVAKEKGITINVLPDIDERQGENVLVAKTKGKALRANIKIEYCEYLPRIKLYDYKFNKVFIKYMQDKKLNDETVFTTELYAYSKNGYVANAKAEIGDACKKILKEKSNSKVEEIKFYITMPYLRPMVPILEILQKEGIEYYIPPIDKDICKYEPIKKIYMDGKNLEKYKEKVHSQISNLEKGVVTIGGDNITEADLILGDLKEHMQEITR